MPEMALVGYRFDNAADVDPCGELVPTDLDTIVAKADAYDSLENKDMLDTFVWAFHVSKQMGGSAWVALGFVERDESGTCLNSSMLVNYSLKRLHIVRKTLLYEDDKKWQSKTVEDITGKPNDFQALELEFPRVGKTLKVGVAICMDINWKDFEEGKHDETPLGDFLAAEGA